MDLKDKKKYKNYLYWIKVSIKHCFRIHGDSTTVRKRRTNDGLSDILVLTLGFLSDILVFTLGFLVFTLGFLVLTLGFLLSGSHVAACSFPQRSQPEIID